jgi:hypothetical protein
LELNLQAPAADLKFIARIAQAKFLAPFFGKIVMKPGPLVDAVIRSSTILTRGFSPDLKTMEAAGRLVVSRVSSRHGF